MKSNVCQDCGRFIQHYGVSDDRYHWVNCGHCVVNSRSRHRQALARACEHFEPCEPKKQVPRDKLIVTVERLRRIVDMEFPPVMPTEE